MEFKSTLIRIGNYEVNNSYSELVTKMTNTSIGVTVRHVISASDAYIVILKKDIVKAEISLQSCAPFIALTLSGVACGRVRKKLGMEDKGKFRFNSRSKNAEEKKFFIFIKEVGLTMLGVLQDYFTKNESLTAKDARNLLEISNIRTQLLLHEIGHYDSNLTKDDSSQSAIVAMIPRTHFAFQVRKIASFVYLFRERKVKKEVFSKYVDAVDTLEGVGDLFDANFWLREMVTDEMNSYIAKLKCSHCSKPGLLKCGNCKDVRYCSVECQVRDGDSHARVCQELRRKGKEGKKDILAIVDKFYTNNDGVTFEYFISKIRSRLHHLIRKYMLK
eukprot:GFUD01042747.1.p1 GENE.GFUD01042747.1~~GFUD01042747.1.p1  ORF type:complete len:331 (-),score=73.48 GFUD01042747.1:2-994(-)